MSFYVDVKDPPSALRPPLAEFGETIKYEKSLQLTSEVSPAFESLEASLGYSYPKYPKSARVSMTPRLATPIENVATSDVSQGPFEPAAEQDRTGWARSSTPGTKST